MTAHKTGVIYCRVSSAEQIGGTSLETQQQACLQYCEANNITPKKVFVERGESAKTAQRTEFIKAIDYCKNTKGGIDVFLVWKIDRFARDTADHFKIKALLSRYGTAIRSVTEIIGEDPQGHLMETILAGFAQFDNDVRAIRSRSGMEARLKQGVWVWRAPLGYYRKAKGANLSIDPETAPMIRKIFELYATGTHTYDSIANLLAKQGYKTATGKELLPQLIEKTIKNPLYCGLIRVWDQEHVGAFEPIIERDLYERCQPGYGARSENVPRLTKNEQFPLRRLVTCATCKKPLTASASTGRHGKRYPYYHHQKQDCPAAAFIPSAKLERDFAQYLDRIRPTMSHERAFKAIVRDTWRDQHQVVLESKQRLEAQLLKLQQERERIFAAHRSGIYSDTEFLEQKNEIDRKLVLARPQYEPDKGHANLDIEADLDRALSFVRHTSANWQKLAHHDKLRFQKLLFKSEIPYDPVTGFGTAELSLIYSLPLPPLVLKSPLVTPTGTEWNHLLEELRKWRNLAYLFKPAHKSNQNPTVASQ